MEPNLVETISESLKKTPLKCSVKDCKNMCRLFYYNAQHRSNPMLYIGRCAKHPVTDEFWKVINLSGIYNYQLSDITITSYITPFSLKNGTLSYS